MSRNSVSSRVARTVLGLFVALGALAPISWGQADVQGQWSTLPFLMTINPIHVALMHNGKILVTTGSGNCPPTQSGCPSGPPYGASNHSGAVVLDPIGQSITQLSVNWDMFCNSMTVLADGRVFINGGTLAFDPFKGIQKSSIFDPATNTFNDTPDMAHGRWYPSVLLLGDGRIMTFSGFLETGETTNTTVEIYTVGSGWSQPYAAPYTPDLYPRLHLLPNGKVFVSGSPPISELFDPSTTTWTLNVATTNYGSQRTYGSSVLLPLTPANNYDPRVMILGGNNPATATTELIDLGSSKPAWAWGPDMSQPRIEMDAVMLPTGKILAVGGSAHDEDATTASLNADLYDPASNSFSSAGANAYPRLYHTVALLLPDATVWLGGSNPARGTYEPHMEIYQPAYLFTRDANNNLVPATRPTIANAPSHIAWGGSFTISTPDAANTSQAVLLRPGSSTHAFDMDQRLIAMSFTAGSGTLTVTAPPNSNIAPPGYYMLFLINSKGVPSVASFLLLDGSSSAPAPTVTSISPNSGTGSGGTAVTIAGTNFGSGATVSFGGTAATGITVVSSNSITATTPAHAAGAVTVVVTNADGQPGNLVNGYTYTNPAPAPTATSIAPDTGPVAGGMGVTITGANFLAGATVSFGGTAATGVTVINTSSITATTPAHAAGAVNIVVTNGDAQSGILPNGYTYTSLADFTITASAFSPATVAAGGAATSTITISPLNGFNGAVSLSCSGIAPRATPAPTCSFSPNSVANGSGTSTLTVSTTAATTASRAPQSKGIFYAMWLPIGGLMVLGTGFTSGKKRFLCSLFGCLLFSGLIFLVACGGGSSSFGGSGGGVPGTPVGVYNVTISGSGSLTHTTTVSVTVN